MKKFVLVLSTIAALGASAAMAQTMVEDTDGDGSYNMDEMKAAYPDLTEETFGEVDADADGMVSADELTAAQESGLLGA